VYQRPPFGHRGATGKAKRRYPTRALAKAGMLRVLGPAGRQVGKVYACPTYQGFHWGHAESKNGGAR
jgi:hypothetical protein